MKTKTRSSVISLPTSTDLNYYDDVGSSNYGNVKSGSTAVTQTFDATFNGETITYEEPRYKSNGSCAHSRTTLIVYPSSKVERVTRLDGSHEKHVRQDYYLCNTFHAQIRTAPSVTFQGDQWDAWSSEALDSLLPTFSEGGESLVNFVLELKQLKGLFVLWKRRETFLRNIANGHLNVSFGWLPFISDAKRIYGALDNFRKKVRELQKNSKIPQKRHYKRFLDIGSLPGNLTLYSDASVTVSRETLWVQKPIYHATVDFIYELPDMSDMTNQVKAFLDSLGVQRDATILWNAIPYSFVVDWFFGVGRWIHSLRSDNLKIPATVTGFAHSLKWEWRARYAYKRTPVATDLGDQFVILADRSALRYERRRDIPSYGTFSTTVRAPNWGQIALGASLTVQRL